MPTVYIVCGDGTPFAVFTDREAAKQFLVDHFDNPEGWTWQESADSSEFGGRSRLNGRFVSEGSVKPVPFHG